MNQLKRIGYTTISLEYSRYYSPKYVHGGLTLKFSPAPTFSFMSEAIWPDGDQYEVPIQEEIRSTLEQAYAGEQNYAVTLVDIKWDPVNSCEIGFRRAARAATLSAMETSSKG